MSISGNNKNALEYEERILLDLRFKQNLSLKKCASVLGITISHAQRILTRALKKTIISAYEAASNITRLNESKKYWRSRSKKAEQIIETLCAENDKLKYALNVKQEMEITDVAAFLTDDTKTLGLSARSCNCLIRHGATSVGDILNIEPREFTWIRNLGEKSQEEVIRKMRELGFESWAQCQEEYLGRSR
jgi:transcriptional regulator with XRE-family HTH domain